MDLRQKNLLKLLIDAQAYLAAATIADELSCSEKTVRIAVRAVNGTLESEGLVSRIVAERGKGIMIDEVEEEHVHLEMLARDEGAIPTEGGRRAWALLVLAEHPGRYSVDVLAHKLLMNKQHLRASLRTWEPLLRPFHVHLDRTSHLTLVGTELDVRFMVLNVAYIDAPVSVRKTIDQLFLLPSHAQTFDRLLSAVESEQGFRVSANARRQFGIIMEISVRRIKAGRAIGALGYEAFPALMRLRDRAWAELGVRLVDDELAFASEFIRLSCWQWNASLLQSYRPAEKACEAAARMEHALENRYGRPLEEFTRKPLAVLTELALRHRPPAYPPPNPNAHLAKYGHMEQYLAFSCVLYDTPELECLRMCGSDQARFSLMLADYLRVGSPQRSFRTGLVVNAGIEQVAYSLRRIERELSFIKICDVFCEDDLECLQRNPDETDLDFLISFTPITQAGLPVAVVSAELNARDIARITSTIACGITTGARCETALQSKAVLTGTTIGEAFRSLYRIVAAEGTYTGDGESFIRRCLAQLIDHEGIAVAALMCADVARTDMRAFSLACVDTTASCAATLLVSPHDQPDAAFIVQRFKRLVDSLVSR